jgi:3-phosphoglycerate kinase
MNLTDLPLEGERALIRVDFQSPLELKRAKSLTTLASAPALPTIKHVLRTRRVCRF